MRRDLAVGVEATLLWRRHECLAEAHPVGESRLTDDYALMMRMFRRVRQRERNARSKIVVHCCAPPASPIAVHTPPCLVSAIMRRVTQDAFDSLIAENINDFGMEPAEALEEAIAALKLQSVDLGNIRTTLPEQGGRRELRAVVATRSLATALEAAPVDAVALGSALELLERELVGEDVEPDAVPAAGA